MTLFDDASSPPEESQSRALELHINTTKHEVTLVHQYLHSPPTLATSKGSAQPLSNSNMFVGWGLKPFFSEYSPKRYSIVRRLLPVTRQLLPRIPLHLGRKTAATARDRGQQSATTTGEDNVYASWNGATQVASWQVLASSSSGGPFVNQGSPAPWSGFETTIQTANANYFEVEALNSRGRVLGTSTAVAGP